MVDGKRGGRETGWVTRRDVWDVWDVMRLVGEGVGKEGRGRRE